MLDDDRFYLGLMSGTSMDGVDAVLVRFQETQVQVSGHVQLDMPIALREALTSMVSSQRVELAELLEAESGIAELYAEAAMQVLSQQSHERSQVAAIGSHGQTICHRPDLGATLQIGDPSRIAELTGITTVADFRRRDMAASGQGAPLAPAFHAAALRSPDENRAILNLGGIANVTWLASERGTEAIGFDTGPANTLLDYWISHHLGASYDENGQWARSGSIHRGLLEQMLQDPFIATRPPKSTGREHFNPDWLNATLQRTPGIDPKDVQATLTELTAVSIARNILEFCGDTGALYACGGGANNSHLMERISAHLEGFEVKTTDALGIPVQMMEAVAFAWLARQTLNGLPGNLPSVTGADHEVILGGIFPGSGPGVGSGGMG